ncbi:MAG: phosphatase PAP2 family protein [Eubacteriales bacterium]|nr:phosphatase PAP2 family protein [Eubacteriales bacterium]
MKKKSQTCFVLSAALLILFVLLTLALPRVDVQPIGPQGSSVGFAGLNGRIHRLVSVQIPLYTLTDWASIGAILVALGFAVLGLAQLIRRKSLRRVDGSLLVLGGFYLLVLFAYVFFEYTVINRRPVLLDGVLEASYPSSTTMLVLCILPTAMLQFYERIQNRTARRVVLALCGGFTLLMVVGRLLSGVHWFTDILGGVLISGALVLLYQAVVSLPGFPKIRPAV